MADESKKTTEEGGDSNTLYYGIGAAILILLVAGFYFLKSKGEGPVTSPSVVQSGPTSPALVRPTSPITGLACEIQYYNPKIGFNQYFLSVAGADVAPAKTVDCDFTVTQNQRVAGTDKQTGVALEDEATRSGKIFTCVSKALGLQPNIPTKVDVSLKDDAGKTATCSSTFLLPKG